MSIKEKAAQLLVILREKTARVSELLKRHLKMFPIYREAVYLLVKRDFKERRFRVAGAGALGLVLILSVAIFSATGGQDPADVPIEDEIVGLDLQEAVPLAEPDFTQVYVITADGKEIVEMATMEEAEDVLSGITERYKVKGSEIVSLSFKETVSIEPREADDSTTVFSVDDAISYVITGTTEPRTYVIKGGDNLWDVAIAHGISPYALQDMNPDLDPKKLRIGQEIYLYETYPFVTVSFTEKVTVEERIAYQVVYEDNDSMYKGQTQVKSVGSYGSKVVVSEVTKENGVVVSNEVLSEEIVAEPVTQVAYRGTLPTPVYTGTSTGVLSSPLASVNVISNYGSRGSRLHRGVDLKGPAGTPIYAAADGVVTFSGHSGSFGNIVKLSHGNGLETYYAHNSTNLVAVGETVTSGQQIATMGSTGNATTSHLHFEVRINGTPQNPMNYI